jgi:hypothetical protein
MMTIQLTSLSVSELADYIQEMRDSEIAEIIVQHKLDGECLVSLGNEDIKDLFPLVGDQMFIKRIIRESKV